jgi:hypothetical protein
MNNIKTNKPERGQSLIELALTFTFLMFLFAGAVDLGRAKRSCPVRPDEFQ